MFAWWPPHWIELESLIAGCVTVGVEGVIRIVGLSWLFT